MRFLFIYLFLSSLANCSEQDIAMGKAIEAGLAYPNIKSAIELNSKKLIKKTELDEDFVKNFAIVIYMSQANKISTEKFGHTRYNLERGYIIPDAYYIPKNNDVGFAVRYRWSF